MKTETLIVRVTPEMKRDFEKAAENAERDPADFHRRIIQQAINKNLYKLKKIQK